MFANDLKKTFKNDLQMTFSISYPNNTIFLSRFLNLSSAYIIKNKYIMYTFLSIRILTHRLLHTRQFLKYRGNIFPVRTVNINI